jgi:hypothetical protein
MGLYKIMNKRSLEKILNSTLAIAVEKISKLKECDHTPKTFFSERSHSQKSFLLQKKRGDRTIPTSERSPSTQSSSSYEEVVNQTRTNSQ